MSSDHHQTGLADKDPQVRAVALVGVVSRAAGPRFAPTDAVANDWTLDREYIQGLRPLAIQLLQPDPTEAIRVDAVTALASLDFDVVAQDARVKIVAGFGTDRTTKAAAIPKLITDAFGNPGSACCPEWH